MFRQITIIIAARNRKHTVTYVLETLAAQNYPSEKFEVILVDDNSTDGTLKAVTSTNWPMQMEFLPSGRSSETSNYWFSLNLGLEKAKGELILFLDSDLGLAKNALTELVKTYNEWEGKGEQVAIRGWWKRASGFKFSRRRLLINRYHFKQDLKKKNKLIQLLEQKDNLVPEKCHSCFLMVPTSKAREIGGMPGHFTSYGNDGVFQKKLHDKAGVRFVFCPEAFGLHKPLWGDETNKRYKSTRIKNKE